MIYRHLNEKDRFYIEQRLSEGDSLRSIARALGFSPSTISREIKRHTPIDFKGLYCHRLTSRCAQEKRANAKQGQAFQQISEEEKMLIHQRLSTHTSPDVISQELIRTVVGRDHQSYLLTLVDKANKMCCIRKMPNKQAKTVINTFMNVVGSTFFDFKTITSDNGTEFAGHEAISKITEADFYFARPYRSCDRGLNEHTNGLIRRFLPKGTDFNEVSDKEIAKIEHTLNTRRRASLNYRSPNHVFLEYLMAA